METLMRNDLKNRLPCDERQDFAQKSRADISTAEEKKLRSDIVGLKKIHRTNTTTIRRLLVENERLILLAQKLAAIIEGGPVNIETNAAKALGPRMFNHTNPKNSHPTCRTRNPA